MAVNVLTKRNKMCKEGVPELPGHAYKLLDFLATGPFSTQSGVYQIMTGAIGDYISHDAEILSADNWRLFRQHHPQYTDKTIKPKDPHCYPILDLLGDQGLIRYDKKNHVMKVNNIYDYITIGGNSLKLLQNLQNNFLDVKRHSFFHEYLYENKDMLLGVFQKASKNFDEYVKKNKVTDKTVDPNKIEIVAHIKNMLEAPVSMISVDKSM